MIESLDSNAQNEIRRDRRQSVAQTARTRGTFMAQTIAGGDRSVIDEQYYQSDDQSGEPDCEDTSQIVREETKIGLSQYPESFIGRGNTGSMLTDDQKVGLRFDQRTGVVHRVEETKTTRIINPEHRLNDSMRSSNGQYDHMEGDSRRDVSMNFIDGENDTSANAWERNMKIQQMTAHQGMTRLEEVEQDDSGSQI